MLTKVYLDGEMGRRFGRKWELAVNSPAEALRIIDANCPDFIVWMRDNLDTYAHYRVVCKYDDGSTAELNTEAFALTTRKPVSIRFVPLVAGAGGGIGQIIVGAVMIYIAVQSGGTLGPAMAAMMKGAGIAMMLGGVIQVISKQPKSKEAQKYESHYFDGADNPMKQGLPVKLVYGKVRAGAQPVSVTMSIDQLMN